MAGKETALLLQIATADGSNRQQMVALPTKTVFKRTVSATGRTQWRAAYPDNLPGWIAGYLSTATTSSPDPLNLTHGLALMEVTDAEVAEMSTAFPRNVGLRYQRVIDAMDDPTDVWPITGLNDVEQYVKDWMDAARDGDTDWIDRHMHPAGSAKASAPAAPAPSVKVSEPAPIVDPFAASYPPIDKDGFVTRPNGEKYRVRMIEGKQDVMLLREARLERDHVFLTGDPGTGKTAVVEAAFGTELVTMLGTEDTEVSDYVGGYVPSGKQSKPYRWQDGALALAMERGVPLFVDEGAVISPKTNTILYSVMDGRDELNVTANPKRGTIKAKPGFFVVIATNPHAPGVRISEALTSRMAITIEVSTDYKMMRSLGVPDEAVTMSENLLTRRKAGDGALWVPQARELLRYKRQVEKYGQNIAIRNLIASAPEDDREVVIEVVQRVTGTKYALLSL
jgi:nitric oxide reductase NorQ protein